MIIANRRAEHYIEHNINVYLSRLRFASIGMYARHLKDSLTKTEEPITTWFYSVPGITRPQLIIQGHPPAASRAATAAANPVRKSCIEKLSTR